MPIYEQSYRRYEARAPLRRVRFWPITREALRLILAKRAFLGLLALSWLPFVGFVIYIYGVTRFGEAGQRMLPLDGRLFGQFFDWQLPLALLLTTFGGAGLVANDLRTGAMLVYLSRPLTRRDYVLGKLCVLLALNLSVTLVPGVLLYGAGLALAPENFLKWEMASLGPAAAAQGLAVSLVLSLVALAVSALCKSARVAGLGFFGLLVGLEMVRGVLRLMLDLPAAAVVSLQADLRAVGRALFGVEAPRWDSVEPAYAALALAVACAGCLLVLRWRVRAVEIVR
jgi:ABC-2 type transport system permease protein